MVENGDSGGGSDAAQQWARRADVTYGRDEHPIRSMLTRMILLLVLASGAAGTQSQAPAVDTSRIGPQVGAVVPAVDGVDQFGNHRALSTIYGPKGAMLVFFRSADW